MGKKVDLSEFECGMVVGARLAGLSDSETVNLLGFSHKTISGVYREWSEKQKISGENALLMAEARGKGPDWFVRADRKATVTIITTRYNQGMLKRFSEHTTRRTLKQMRYSGRRPQCHFIRYKVYLVPFYIGTL